MDFLTHTFCDRGEGHVGGGQVGQLASQGVPVEELRELADKHPHCRFVDLAHAGHDAGVLVVEDGVDKLLGSGGKERLLAESLSQPFDTTFLNTRRNLVQNKHGRRNNCYADFQQDPDIPSGTPTVVDFASTPEMKKLREALPGFFGAWAEGLVAETNHYTDVSSAKVGIGFQYSDVTQTHASVATHSSLREFAPHCCSGDSERRKVVGVRLGKASTPIRFQWYHRSLPLTEELEIGLRDGDMYVMSDKAVGFDWRRTSIPTLRHGTGRKALRRRVGESRKRVNLPLARGAPGAPAVQSCLTP